MEPMDPADLRISDADRHRVAEALREAAGDGRIDLEELEERLEATYAAKTYRDLVPITLDLPGHAAPPVPAVPAHSATPARRTPVGAPVAHGTSLAIMSETRRHGVWDIGNVHTATAVMGSVVIDLREARFPAGEVLINASAVMGSVEIFVDATTAVHVDGIGIMGVFQEGRARVAPEVGSGSPVVRVRGLALMGSVEVRRKGPPGELGRTIRKHLGH